MSRRRLFFRKRGDTDSFIMRVKTDNAGTSSSTQFTIPTTGTGYSYDVKTSDGQTITGNTGNLTITFPSAGTYEVKITGNFPRIYFNNAGDRRKLLEVKQWGTISWTTFSRGFYGCENCIFSNIPDVPTITAGTTDKMSLAFFGCTALTIVGRFNEWNLTGNTSLATTFALCTNFNQNIGAWDVSDVSSFQQTFLACTNFNNGSSTNIDNWNFKTTGTVDFSGMFRLASAFNQPINSWNTERVTTMGGNNLGMFQSATAFNQNIGSWNVSLCTNFFCMFQSATNFNNGSSDTIKNWNVANATTLRRMFISATNFNQPIGSWVLTSTTDITEMFSSATNFNQNIGAWRPKLVNQAVSFMAGKTNLNYSTTNLDAIYNGWTEDSLQPSLTIGFGTIKYTSAGSEGRALLTRTNATVAITNAVNNGSGLIRISATAHGLSTGNKCFISGVVGTTEANGAWIVTVIDANTIDLQGSTFTNTYTSGGTLRTGYGWTITDGGI